MTESPAPSTSPGTVNDDANLFRHLVDNAPDAVVLIADRVIAFANPAAVRMYGVPTPEAMIGRDIGEFLHPEDRDETLQRQDRIVAGQPTAPMERRMLRADGSVIWTEARGTLTQYRGRPAVLAIIRDISERHAMQAQISDAVSDLRSANAELTQFAEATSQDLREPLRTIGSFLQLLRRRSAGQLDAESQDYLEEALGWLKRMETLIEDLKMFSRINTHGRPLRNISLDAVLTASTRRLAREIEAAGFTWVANDLPEVLGDEPQLVQLFSQLVTNAIKYAQPDEPPFMEVSAERDRSGDWCISFADNGIGIDTPYRTRVFEIFRRLHTRDQSEGTGIGLAISRRIVERHGGRIWVESEPGAGSTFRFTLKAVPQRQ